MATESTLRFWILAEFICIAMLLVTLISRRIGCSLYIEEKEINLEDLTKPDSSFYYPPTPSIFGVYNQTFLIWNVSWQPTIPAVRSPVPSYAIWKNTMTAPMLNFEDAIHFPEKPPLSDMQIWNISQQRCGGHGLYVYNSPLPWCDCYFGWKGSRCGVEDVRPMRNAILFLAYGGGLYLEEITKNLHTIERHWRPTNPDVDIIVFVDSKTLSARNSAGVPLRELVVNATSYNVRYLDVWLDLPDNEQVQQLYRHDSSASSQPTKALSCESTYMNYLHMNRFFAVQMFSHPVFYEYDYILRMDSHLYTTGPVRCNIFKTAAATHAVFSYLRGGIDKEECMQGGREVSLEYAITHRFPHNHLHYTYPPNATAYSGAFTWFKTSFWRHPELQRFFYHFDKSGWIYKSRTTDQVMTMMTTALFVPEYAVTQVCCFDEVFMHNKERFHFHPCISPVPCLV